MAQVTVRRYVKKSSRGRTFSVRSYTANRTPKSAGAMESERQRRNRLAKSARERAHLIQAVRKAAISNRGR